MIILSEKKIDTTNLPSNVSVRFINTKNITQYNNNNDVIAIIGSRATAIKVINLDFPNLVFFQLTSAGYDGVPLERFNEKQIIISNAGDVYSVPIAETVVYGMLQVCKRYRRNLKSHVFRLTRKYKYITELSQKKALIMGTGRIGTEVAKRLKSFDMKVYGYDPYVDTKKPYDKIYNNLKELEFILSDCDYLIITLPDTNETRNMIDKSLLGILKKETVIINVGRKAVFNEKDLYYTLKNRKIEGAVLDMFEIVPNPITNKFRRLNNVIVLPGVSAISKECTKRLENHIILNINNILAKEKPLSIINEVPKCF